MLYNNIIKKQKTCFKYRFFHVDFVEHFFQHLFPQHRFSKTLCQIYSNFQNNCSKFFQQNCFFVIVFQNRLASPRPLVAGHSHADIYDVASAFRSSMMKQILATFLENRFCHQKGVSKTDLIPRLYFTGWRWLLAGVGHGWLVGHAVAH